MWSRIFLLKYFILQLTEVKVNIRLHYFLKNKGYLLACPIAPHIITNTVQTLYYVIATYSFLYKTSFSFLFSPCWKLASFKFLLFDLYCDTRCYLFSTRALISSSHLFCGPPILLFVTGMSVNYFICPSIAILKSHMPYPM